MCLFVFCLISVKQYKKINKLNSMLKGIVEPNLKFHYLKNVSTVNIS